MTTNTMREAVLKILTSYEQEMEHYGYYESNPGVSVDDFEEIADEIVAWQAAQSAPVVDTDKTGICIDGVHMAPVATSITAQELDALRKDAERYRYLSSMATQQADTIGPIFRIDVRRTPKTLFNFDAAIDHDFGCLPFAVAASAAFCALLATSCAAADIPLIAVTT